MTLVKAKPTGFNPGQRLLASELNTMQNEYVKAVDGYGGGLYSLTAPLVLSGDIDIDSTGNFNAINTVFDASTILDLSVTNEAEIEKAIVLNNIYLPGLTSMATTRVDSGNIDLAGQIRYDEEIVSCNLFGARIGTSAVNWVYGEEVSSGGASTPYFETSVTSASGTGRLWVDIPHPKRQDYYLKGLIICSQHMGTLHYDIPARPFKAEIYQIRPNGSYLYRSDNAASTTNVTFYEAAQDYGIVIPTTLRPLFADSYKYVIGLDNESGANALTGRRVRAVFAVFTLNA